MKLVMKLTAALVVGMVLVLALNGYFRIRREVALLQADRVRDHALIGSALGAAVSAAWRVDGKAEALRLLDAANGHEGGLRIHWVDNDTRELGAGQTTTTLVGDQRNSYTAVTLGLGSERVGFVELSERLEAEHRATEGIVADTLRTTITLILVCGALAGFLGIWLVGRPVRALSAKARRIGEGDFTDPLVLDHRDELGLLAREMNAMCARLTEAADRVDREVAARLATLEQLRHVDRLTTVGKLASGVAHELGTPLNVVGARAKMIANGRTKPTETAEYAQIIADAADRMTQIIRQMLTFARRKPATAKTAADLRKLATDTTRLLRPLADKANVEFDVENGAEVTAAVDSGAIQQVLTNIFVNGIHSMPDGGKIAVTFAAAARRATEEHPGKYVAIRIRDHGTGILPEDQAHIFEPFFTTKEVGSGTGLGLSVAYGIIEDHGGFIEVESSPGSGSLFTVYLPSSI
jgi:signal transduction histidine kinase